MKSITMNGIEVVVEWENPSLGIWFNNPEYPGARFYLSEQDLAVLKRLVGEVREEKWIDYLSSRQQELPKT